MSRPLAAGVTTAIVLATSIAMLGERGAFTSLNAARAVPAIAGLTVADDAAGATMPVVTSLRSGGKAERAGLRVGDRIAAIDGLPVRDVAGLARVVRSRRDSGPVSLHIRRGDAVWTIAIAPAEAETKGAERHDPQDPAG